MNDIIKQYKEEEDIIYCSHCHRPYVMKKKRIKPDVTIKALSEYFEVDLVKKTRKQIYVVPRQIAQKVLYEFSDMSLQDIADAFNPAISNHTTVINSLRIIKDRIKYEPVICDAYNNAVEIVLKAHEQQ
jgi:chromosomal replication initiation ATPase DnaA